MRKLGVAFRRSADAFFARCLFFLFFVVLQYLYTLKVTDQAKADKISQSFPPGLKKQEL